MTVTRIQSLQKTEGNGDQNQKCGDFKGIKG